MKIVLNHTHLNIHGKRKNTNDLTVMDFRLPHFYLARAHKILYKNGNRCIVLKERFPTEYSITKKRRDRLGV